MLASGGLDLLQAASLLSQIGRAAGHAAPGEGATPWQEAFRFRGVPHFRFALSEVEGVAWPSDPGCAAGAALGRLRPART